MTVVSIVELHEPDFTATAPTQFEIAYFFSKSQGGYVAVLADDSSTHCLDVLAEDAELNERLARFDRPPQVLFDRMPARFILTIDGEARVPSSRASYQSWQGEDEPIISSSAWYGRDGQQNFLGCPQSTFDWRVYRVSDIEEIQPSSAP